MMPRYEIALTMNATAAPTAATIAPPIAGPRLRARLKPTAFAMTAGAIWLRGTMSPIDACHAGASTAVPQPIMNVSNNSSAGVTAPARVITASAIEASSVKTCEASMIVRRSRVSASAPAISDRKKKGSAPAVCTSATWSADGAIVSISHDAPTVWIMPPNDDTSQAHQNSVNVRCSNGASVARRQRSNPEWPSSGGPDMECYVRAGPQVHCIFVTAGGFHEPSMIDGGVSVGQYMRSVTLKGPEAAGSQFDSLSLPGEAACT